MNATSKRAPRVYAAAAAALFPGIAPALADKLMHLGLRRTGDLVFHLPLRYEDETRITAIADANPGLPTQFEATVVSCEVAFRPRRQLMARVADAHGDAMALRFLNFYPSQQKALQEGARLRIFGEPREGFYGTEIVHPRFRVLHADEPLPDRLTPVYPTTAGLPQPTLRKLIRQALEGTALGETLPEEIRAALKLPPVDESLRFLHEPPPEVSLAELEAHGHPAWRRIAFDELLAQQLSLRRAYAARRTRGAPPLPGDGTLTRRLLAALPFELTAAQRRVHAEIAADLAQPHPAQRLLQGDVGSGKTVIAALAMLQAVESGYQAALMAPTEILAEQHYRKLQAWLAPLGIEVAWLSGSLKKRDKAAMIAAIVSGRAPLAVGTHALIEAGVDFARLGLAIVDEQHRFGVRQRLALKQKGHDATIVDDGASCGLDALGAPPPVAADSLSAHQLTMSATPIPRTLAMSYYADLDVSVIDELPPGRTPIVTKLVAEARRAEVMARVRDACRAGRQAYWVCPLIEENGVSAEANVSSANVKRSGQSQCSVLQLKTAQETFEHLVAELPELRIGLVHGRLKADAKAAAMTAFQRNEIQVLVATTVIEVGVDVANASLMVIEHAERFGLAQLHQLRGRVGRGSHDSACILLFAQPLGQTARARLKAIFENTDGFEIARLDLELRGPGEFVGARQSGAPLLRFADLNDVELVEQVRDVAERMLAQWPEHADAHLQRWLGGREELLKA